MAAADASAAHENVHWVTHRHQIADERNLAFNPGNGSPATPDFTPCQVAPYVAHMGGLQACIRSG